MKNKLRFRFGKATLISSILGYIGYFVINDLKKDNSIIKSSLKNISLKIRKRLLNTMNTKKNKF